VTTESLATELMFAGQLADAADAVTMAHFRAPGLVVDTKADKTEVTIADRNSELAIRNLLAEHRPHDGILGEEHGTIDGTSGRRWIIDPIDGTSNYVRGVPVWATLIALEDNGVPVIGVASCPALGRRWWGGLGLGAFVNGEPISVSTTESVETSFLSYCESPFWASRGRRNAIDELRARVGRERAFGDFWQHMLVAEGSIDIAVEAIVSHWDLAAVQAIVEAAGGRFTDLDGVRRPDGGSAVSTNELLHELVINALSPTLP
jgi:histidinol-phosphatase